MILDIHTDFIEGIHQEKSKKRRTRTDIRIAIMQILRVKNASVNAIYEELGYSGRPSKVFRDVVQELISKNIISYKEENHKNSSKSVLRIVDKCKI